MDCIIHPSTFRLITQLTALNDTAGPRRITQILTTIDPSNRFAVARPINIYGTLRAQGVIAFPFPTQSITAADLTQFGIDISTAGPRPPFEVRFSNTPDFRSAYTHQASLEREYQSALGLLINAGARLRFRAAHWYSFAPPLTPVVGKSAISQFRTVSGVPKPAFTKIAAMSAPAMTTTG
jgi:hypothetical protein